MKKKLFISNLAWENKNFDIVKKLIKFYRFDGIDLAPLKIIGDWKNLKKKSIENSRELKKNKIKVNAIQGIYFKNVQYSLSNYET